MTATVRVVSPAQLTAADVRAWSELEARALEPNMYMSPHFVLPALEHLDPDLSAEVWFVELGSGATRRLVGAGVFHRCAMSRHIPFPHISIYRSCHSFRGGPLLDVDHAESALSAVLACAASKGALALNLQLIDADGPIASLLDRSLAERGSFADVLDVTHRAFLRPETDTGDVVKAHLGNKRWREIMRCHRKLSTSGEVRWESFRGAIGHGSIEAFLVLEHSGWKGRLGSSLRSLPSHEAFFRAMTAAFASDGRAWFTELSVDGKVVASSANFISGSVGFAFKVGGDPELRSLGVGILNEVELVRRGASACGDLDFIDSCARPGSFIESLWPGRRSLGCVVVPLGLRGHIGCRVVQAVRQFKQRAQGTASTTWKRLGMRGLLQPADMAGSPPASNKSRTSSGV